MGEYLRKFVKWEGEIYLEVKKFLFSLIGVEEKVLLNILIPLNLFLFNKNGLNGISKKGVYWISLGASQVGLIIYIPDVFYCISDSFLPKILI